MREPVIVTDARKDARFIHNLAIRDLGVIAYLGAPLITVVTEINLRTAQASTSRKLTPST